MSEYNRNDIKKLIDLLEKEFRGRSKKNTTFLRDGESKAKFSNSSVDVDAEFKILEKKRKIFEDTQKMHKHYIRTMAEGIPIIGTLVKSIGRNTKIIEENMRGQSNAYKHAAKATEEYTYRVGQNSKDLYIVQKTLAEVQKKAEELAKLSENRSKIEERIYKNAKKVKIDGFGKLKTDMSNLGDMMAKTAKRLKQERGSDAEPLLQKMVSDLKELSKIPSLVASIKSDLRKTELKNAMKKDQALAAIMKPVIKGSEKDLQQSPKAIKKFSDDVTDTFRGSFDTLSTIIEKNISDIEKAFNKLTESLTDTGAVISASLLAFFKKEAEMTLKRQQLTGRMFSTSMRMEAIGMGVSEVELLTSVAENRYALRRLGQSEGFKGADDFIASKTFEEMRKSAIQMGYINSEALKKIMDTVEVLRKIGADESAQAVSNALKFQKDLFKDLGITQDQMAQFYAEMMSPENALRLIAGGPGTGTFATQEAMHEEIAVRAKLARVLNQDLEIQKKRLQEQQDLALGDPISALQQAVGSYMLAKNFGMSEEKAALIARYKINSGFDMKDAKERAAAELATQRLMATAGKTLVEASRDTNLNVKFYLNQIMGEAGITHRDAILALMRTGGDEIPQDIQEALGLPIIKTQTPPKDMGDITMKIINIAENIKGIMESSFGNFIVGMFSGVAGGVFAYYKLKRLISIPAVQKAIEKAAGFIGQSGEGAAARTAAQRAGTTVAQKATLQAAEGAAAQRAGTTVAQKATLQAAEGAAARTTVRGVGLGLGRFGGIVGAAIMMSPDIINYVVNKYYDAKIIESKKELLKTQDRLISAMLEKNVMRTLNNETLETIVERRNKLAEELAAAGQFTDNIYSMRLFEKLTKSTNIPFNERSRLNLLELIMEESSKRRPHIGFGVMGESSRSREARMMIRTTEQAIIDFANSDMLSNTTVKDVDSLQKMVDYLKEDGISELYGEKEAFEKIVDRLEQLIRINEDDLNATKQAALQAEIRFRGINEREDALKIDQIVRGTIQDMMQTATRRLELLGYDSSGLV